MSSRHSSPHARATSDDAEASSGPDEVVAAGGVVWRGDPSLPEIALVHRPAYDDWSFPKGKVDAGEHLLAAAVREIAEELGSRVELGVPLPTARYTVRFDATWTAQTHPLNYPAGAHWSALVGGTHDATIQFWQEGQLASQGIKDMAERGLTAPLAAEVQAQITAGHAGAVILAISGAAIPVYGNG